MARGDVAEAHRRAQIDAAAGILPAHDAGHRRTQHGIDQQALVRSTEKSKG
jgi:hypothetical protein